MLLDMMNNVINDDLALILVDVCFDNTLQVPCKSLLCFATIWKIDDSKTAKI